MKIKIELDIQADEVPLANELLSTLRLLTEHAKAPPPVVKNTAELLDDLIKQLGDDAARSTAGSSILSMLTDPSYGPQDKLVSQLADAYQKHVFTPEFVGSGRSVVPYLEFLKQLQDGDVKGKVRDVLVAKIVPQLAKKRGPGTDRKEFFAYAEAFAFFAAIELMSLEGAMTTMGKLLLRPETRSAAVCMLGKTAELCADTVLHKCKPEVVATVRKQLEAANEEAYRYDVAFICKALGWALPAGRQPNGPASMPLPPPGISQPPQAQQGAGATQLPLQMQKQQQPAAAPPPASSMPIPTPAQAPQQDMAMPMPVPMPTPTPAAAPAAAAPPGTRMGLTHVTTLAGGHLVQPYYICHDTANDLIVSGGKDGDFTVWDINGRILQRVQTPMYICGMDLAPQQQLLYMCAFSQEQGSLNVPCLNVYASGREYTYKCTMAKPDCMLMASVQSVGTDCFMLAESLVTPSGSHECVALYDTERALGSQSLTPVTQFMEHTDIVTCMAGSASNPNICFSGSKDCVIKLWDKRQSNGKSVGTFAAPLMDAQGNFVMRAHNDMVTCLDSVDTLLVSTSADNHMHFWDLRNLSVSPQACAPVAMVNVGPAPAVKVRVNACPVPNRAVISTFSGVHLVDYTNLAAPVVGPPCVSYGGTNGWIEIRWVHGKLYCSGNENLDVYELV